jgi:hypothetical protein
MIRHVVLCLLILGAAFSTAETRSSAFPGADEWKAALTTANINSLKHLYSTDPPARFVDKEKKAGPDILPETTFWQQILASGASDFDVRTMNEQDQQGLHTVALQVAMKVKTPQGPRTRYVTEQQAWQDQGGQWRIVLATHSDVVKMRPALKPNPNLYDKNADARSEIKEAVGRAGKDHQRVILVFGANWCYDCHVLDQAFHQEDIAPLLKKSFQVVHVDIGDDGKKNNDLAQQYDVPLERGVPALAILGADGKLLYSQKNGEFEKARALDPDEVIAFLNKWKP